MRSLSSNISHDTNPSFFPYFPKAQNQAQNEDLQRSGLDPMARAPEEEIMNQPVKRPWWCIQNLIKAIWVGSVCVLTVISMSAVITAVALSSITFSFIALVSTVALGVLLGAAIFEAVRKAHFLPIPLQKLAEIIHTQVAELFSLLASSSIYLGGFFHTDKYEEVNAPTRPILFVHGYLHNQTGNFYMGKRCKHAGLGQVYGINLGNPLTFKSIEEYAAMVQAKIDEIVAETGSDKIVVIGHSMGGLVAAQAATTLDEQGYIDQIITLASPLRGTKASVIAYGKCAKQMREAENNPFITDLIARVQRLIPKKIHSFYGRYDLIVWPEEVGYIQGTDGLLLEGHGHLSYLWSDETIDRIIQLIRIGNHEQKNIGEA